MAARVSKAAGGLVHAKLHDYQGFGATKKNPNPNMYKVIISMSSIQADKNQLTKAVAAVFDNLAAPIENSFRKIPNVHGHTYYVGFVARNREIKDYETASVEKMKVMAGNLLMDDEDQSLWEVRSNGDTKYLARHAGDNLEELVCMASMTTDNYAVAQPEFARLGVTAFQRGEFLAYVNPKTLEVSHGWVLADADTGESLDVLEFDEEKNPGELDRVQVDPEMVVESAYVNVEQVDELKEFAATLKAQGGAYDSPEAMKNFYEKVYGYDAAFWKEFKQILDNRSTI